MSNEPEKPFRGKLKDVYRAGKIAPIVFLALLTIRAGKGKVNEQYFRVTHKELHNVLGMGSRATLCKALWHLEAFNWIKRSYKFNKETSKKCLFVSVLHVVDIVRSSRSAV